MSQKVLIIDPNNQGILDHPFTFLQQSGYKLYFALNDNEGFDILKKYEPDIIIVDIDTTNYNAFDFFRRIRYQEEDWTPIIFISKNDEEFDLVLGLELGADDFLQKPVRQKELISRMKSILRRYQISWTKNGKRETNIRKEEQMITNGDLIIYPENNSVYVKDVLIELTMKEFDLLLYLLKNIGIPISRQRLLTVVSDIADPRVIDVFISRLREKIEPSRNRPIYIKTVRKVGYMMIDQKINKSLLS